MRSICEMLFGKKERNKEFDELGKTIKDAGERAVASAERSMELLGEAIDRRIEREKSSQGEKK